MFGLSVCRLRLALRWHIIHVLRRKQLYDHDVKGRVKWAQNDDVSLGSLRRLLLDRRVYSQ